MVLVAGVPPSLSLSLDKVLPPAQYVDPGLSSWLTPCTAFSLVCIVALMIREVYFIYLYCFFFISLNLPRIINFIIYPKCFP